ncbi:uncharacterized protein LOC134958347 isoform X1 [Pseudophryne corroboree]|uniref:uncharacterized protein LOC134958347 isoform X1 n=1 Tax=Pseudophryne corroboree TaxID=495146 RepID=UPI003082025F
MAPRRQSQQDLCSAAFGLGGIAVGQASSLGLDLWSVTGVHRARGLLQSAGSPGEQPNGDGALQQIRIHPGIIAAVVVVALLAVLAAVFIVRKYCCSESNITYRYSVLRRHQEELDNSTTNRLQDDSDEDLLE